MIDRHGNCIGIRLWRSKSRFVQLWICPSGTVVEPHSHNEQDIELMYVFGSTTFHRVLYGEAQSFAPRWYHVGRRFSVPMGTVHWFTVSRWPLFFINFSRFYNTEPKSAAIDFHATPNRSSEGSS